VCADEESSSDTIRRELNIDSGINLVIEGETVSEEWSNEMSENESETSVVACGWVGRCDNGRQETQGIHIY
jgi:hypothetical protein